MNRTIFIILSFLLTNTVSFADKSNDSNSRNHFDLETKHENSNYYSDYYFYPDSPKKDFNHRLCLGYQPDKTGMGIWLLFHRSDLVTRKRLYKNYPVPWDRVLHAPIRTNEIWLDKKLFLQGRTAFNVRYLSIDFPFVPDQLTLTEQIKPIKKSKTITIDSKLPRPDKDARKNRTDWLNKEYFSSYSLTSYPDYSIKRYPDQVSLLVIKTPTPTGDTTHGIRGGCLSSKKSGLITKITISRVSASEKPEKFELVKLDYKMPVFNTALGFLTKLGDTVINADNRQVDVVVECTTDKDIKFIIKKTVLLKKPRVIYSEPYK